MVTLRMVSMAGAVLIAGAVLSGVYALHGSSTGSSGNGSALHGGNAGRSSSFRAPWNRPPTLAAFRVAVSLTWLPGKRVTVAMYPSWPVLYGDVILCQEV